VGRWVNNLTKAPYLLLFVLLISVGVGTASALVTITLAGNTIVQGTLTADEYFDNGNTQTGTDATAIGGISNTASGPHSTVGGGDTNTASGDKSTVGGGQRNIASGDWSVIGGGFRNTAGFFGTVPGGSDNEASGLLSFAAGNNARAQHQGSIVFADSSIPPFFSTAADQFSIKAAGGIRMVGDLTIESEIFCTDCIDSTDIADGQVMNTDIADNSINTAKLVDNAVIFSKIANNAIDSPRILDGSILGLDIKDGTIQGVDIDFGSIFTISGEFSADRSNLGITSTPMTSKFTSMCFLTKTLFSDREGFSFNRCEISAPSSIWSLTAEVDTDDEGFVECSARCLSWG